MDFMDISKMRVTVRKFAQMPVEQDKIEKILEAGRWAPTAVNYQPQRILVLNTPENLAKVKSFCTFEYDKKYADLAEECDDKEHGKNVYYYGAPLVLFVCYDKTACWQHPQSSKSSGATDATIVATHMMLEAASIGLGTVWISYFDENKAKELLNLPESWQPVCMLYVGYPAEDFKPNPNMSGKRFPIEKTCFYNDINDRKRHEV
ncbi:nitroreductase family protein [Thermoanaerobacterium sp. RBIITD]|uniref:nitroreductase family protein n=1 Tax=Thermoanaerobacterium sp. RBIITD TaxID=1550240 RepID=UPI000BB8E50C|nr:nitroreductase family protein [Thermoanaerobacterium sp. RBIITD]SNX54865.1 Nitroreductase [Thermoanaerobacterium sp. RBIITD]